MKSNIFILSVFSFFFLVNQSFAQDNICESSYMPFKEGIYFELTNYDKKGKVASIAKHEVTELENTSDGFKATVEIELEDEKGEKINNGSYGMECRDGAILLDMSSMLNPATMGGMSNMEMEMSGDALEFPNSLTTGQDLPDGTMEMKAMSNGTPIFTSTMNVTDRKVEATESVTTPAGTFDCVKISQNTEVKMLIKKKYKSVSWYAKGVGMVKSENYGNNGKLESSTVLTKLEK